MVRGRMRLLLHSVTCRLTRPDMSGLAVDSAEKPSYFNELERIAAPLPRDDAFVNRYYAFCSAARAYGP